MTASSTLVDETGTSAAFGFLSLLYGDNAPGYMAIWTLSDRKTCWLPANDLAGIAQQSVKLAASSDTYFGIGLHPKPLSTAHRGKAEDVIAIPGMWTDIDVAGPAHKSAKLPRDVAQSRDLIAEFPLVPTVIVHSGHGLQAWWLFPELLTLDTTAERVQAESLAERFQATLRAKAFAHGWDIDSTHDLARVLRVPGTINRKLAPIEVRAIEVNQCRYTADDIEQYLLDPVAVPPNKRWHGGTIPDVVSAGEANDFLCYIAGHYWDQGMPENVLRATIHVIGEQNCVPPAKTERINEIVDWAITKDRRFTAMPRPNGAVPHASINIAKTPSMLGFPLTETGNAERFAAAFGEKFRYVDQWGWLLYDNMRWIRDLKGERFRAAKAVVRLIYHEAGDCLDADLRKAVAQWARVSESRKGIEAMLSLARWDQAIVAEVADFDSDKYLLNVQNGTIDLRTGILQAHNQSNMITKLAPFRYDPGAQAPVFKRFLERIIPSADTRHYLQSWAGYSATGSTQEERISIWWGSGQNGKTTLAKAIQTVLGDYAKQVDPEIIMTSQVDKHPTGKAGLCGIRAAFGAEIDEGRRVAESTLKAISSNDIISARFMNKDFFEFTPTHSLVLLTNHKPSIRGSDKGIWRRIDLVPFTVTIEESEKDQRLPDKLRAESSGILTWIIMGAVNWYQFGLPRSTEINKVTSEYREESDVLGDFLTERCTVITSGIATTKDIYAAYVKWCEPTKEKPVEKNDFSSRMKERGFEQGRTSKQRFWYGIQLDGADEQLPLISSNMQAGNYDTVTGNDTQNRSKGHVESHEGEGLKSGHSVSLCHSLVIGDLCELVNEDNTLAHAGRLQVLSIDQKDGIACARFEHPDYPHGLWWPLAQCVVPENDAAFDELQERLATGRTP